MRSLVRTTVLAALLGVGSAFGAQVSIGIRIGPPPPPRVVRVLPPRPSAEFVWVEGYWYPMHRRYRWHEGYWTRPPYAQARWVSPRYEGEQFYGGYWEGERGRVEHDHRWDRERERDYDRRRERERDRDHERHGDHDDDDRQ